MSHGQHPGGPPRPPGGMPPAGPPRVASQLADGEWHPLSPLTPWAMAGPVGLAVFGVMVSVLVPMIFAFNAEGGRMGRGDFGFFLSMPLILGLAVVALAVAWPFVAIRFVRFRLTAEVFEMRSGVLTKQHRQVRLDRLQSVNIQRSVGARLFGLSAIETSGAGRESDIKLQFIKRDDAEVLRAEILRRASGMKAQKRAAQQGGLDQQGGAPGWAPRQTGGAPSAMTGAPDAVGAPGVAGRPGAGAAVHPDAVRQPGGPGQPGGADQPGYPGAPAHPDAPAHPGAFPHPGAPAQPGPLAHPATPPRRRRSLSDFIDEAIDDFAATDFGPGVPEPAVVAVKPGRYLASSMLSTGLVMAVVLIFVLAVGGIIALTAGAESRDDLFGWAFGLFAGISFIMTLAAAVFGSLAAMLSMLNYRIAGTPDGLKVTRGVFTQSSDTVAPGRIHSVQVNQSLLWRPFGWYQITVNRADLQLPGSDGHTQKAQTQQQRQILLPIGTRDDVARVLALVLPMQHGGRTLALVESGMAPGRSAEFVTAPVRSWWLKPLSFRRTGYAVDRDVVYLRMGWLMRRLAIIPGERIQGVTISTGPLQRAARVVTVSPDTVMGPVTTRLPLVDADSAPDLLLRFEALAVRAAQADTSHRWREAQARLTVASAHMRAADARSRGEQLDPQTLQVLRAEHEWQRAGAPTGHGDARPAGPGAGGPVSGPGAAARDGGAGPAPGGAGPASGGAGPAAGGGAASGDGGAR